MCFLCIKVRIFVCVWESNLAAYTLGGLWWRFWCARIHIFNYKYALLVCDYTFDISPDNTRQTDIYIFLRRVVFVFDILDHSKVIDNHQFRVMFDYTDDHVYPVFPIFKKKNIILKNIPFFFFLTYSSFLSQ